MRGERGTRLRGERTPAGSHKTTITLESKERKDESIKNVNIFETEMSVSGAAKTLQQEVCVTGEEKLTFSVSPEEKWIKKASKCGRTGVY